MSAKMETGLLRYPPFSQTAAPDGRAFPYGGWPAGWAEASQRPVDARAHVSWLIIICILPQQSRSAPGDSSMFYAHSLAAAANLLGFLI